MKLLEGIYRLTHKKAIADGQEVPYYWKYSIFTVFCKPVRKFFTESVIPFIPFNGIRIALYRMCGFKIGKNVFIGMRGYLDDMCYDKIVIEDDVIISYGVFFACHGRNQGHNNIVIHKNAYVGMRCNLIARTDIELGEGCVVGACSMINKSIPPYSVAVGTPARVIRKLEPDS